MNIVTSADGTTIAYDLIGTGPAVIMVGGSFQHRGGDPHTSQRAALLSSDLTVVHYDRRGRGDSSDTAPYAVLREIEDIAALIDAVGGTAALFGMSSGAALALDAAAAGLPVSRIAVYELPAIVDGSRAPVGVDYRQRLEALIIDDRRDEAVEVSLAEAVGVPPEYVALMRQAPAWAGMRAVAHTLPYDAALMEGLMLGRPLPRDRWDAVKQPVLVADGGESPEWIRQGADHLAAILPDARRQTIPGQTHAVEPEALAPVLREFCTA